MNAALLTHKIMKEHNQKILLVDDGQLEPILKTIIFITDMEIEKAARKGKGESHIPSWEFNERAKNPKNQELLKKWVGEHYRKEGYIVDLSLGYVYIHWTGPSFFLKQLRIKIINRFADLFRTKGL